MLAICGNDALRELSSPGKSGSFFYLTQDDRFMIKTVRKSEVKVILLFMPFLVMSKYLFIEPMKLNILLVTACIACELVCGV
jgi:hypothetical protein